MSIRTRVRISIARRQAALLPVAPEIASVAPTSGANAGGETVTLTGTDFTADMVVAFGLDEGDWQNAGSPTYVSPTEFQCSTPAATDIDAINGALGFVADVKVTNTVGTHTLVDAFTYEAA